MWSKRSLVWLRYVLGKMALCVIRSKWATICIFEHQKLWAMWTAGGVTQSSWKIASWEVWGWLFFPLPSHSYYVYLWTVKSWNQCNRLRLIPFLVVWSVENYCKEHQKSEDWNAIFYLGYQGRGPMVDEREFSRNYRFFLTVEGDGRKVADPATVSWVAYFTNVVYFLMV